MSDADAWFHEQMVRIKDDAAPSTGGVRRQPAVQAADAAGSRRSDMTLASVALLALMAAFTMEAVRGPMRADQPFGFVAPLPAFRAAALPGVNGRVVTGPVHDRNAVAMSAGPRH